MAKYTRQGDEMNSSLPDLKTLHLHHPGLTQVLCAAYAEAASVCLSRHHVPPTEFEVYRNKSSTVREVNWTQPDSRTKYAWNNADDATRDGAYAMCLAAVEIELGLVALYRAETRIGADYYVGTPSTSLENSYRLEISGVDHGDVTLVNRRLREKIAQVVKGSSNLPVLASVVGFLAKVINIEVVKE